MLLRGNRLGELAIMDAKTLAEKNVIKMEWCGADGGGGGESEKADKPAAAPPAAAAEEKAKKAAPKGAKESSDPQEGGE